MLPHTIYEMNPQISGNDTRYTPKQVYTKANLKGTVHLALAVAEPSSNPGRPADSAAAGDKRGANTPLSTTRSARARRTG